MISLTDEMVKDRVYTSGLIKPTKRERQVNSRSIYRAFMQEHTERAPTRASCWGLETEAFAAIVAQNHPDNADSPEVMRQTSEKIMQAVKARFDACSRLMSRGSNFPKETREELLSQNKALSADEVKRLYTTDADRRRNQFEKLTNKYGVTKEQAYACVNDNIEELRGKDQVTFETTYFRCFKPVQRIVSDIKTHVTQDDMASLAIDGYTPRSKHL